MNIRKQLAKASVVILTMFSITANAQGSLQKIPTRPDIETSLFWHPQPNARATVLLFPGGAGGISKVVDGRPTGGNFLIRSVPHFLANGFKNAPVKKEVMVDGGADPSGDECGAFHWHGFIGMEEEAVGIIGNWIRNPAP